MSKLKHDKSIARDRLLRRYTQNKTPVADVQPLPLPPTPPTDIPLTLEKAPCTDELPVGVNAMDTSPTSEQKQWLIRLRQSSEDLLKILTSVNK